MKSLLSRSGPARFYWKSMGRWAAVCQMTVTNQLKENLEQARELVAGAASRGADMVFLPEAADYVGENAEESLALAQPLTGSTLRYFQNLAETHNVWLSLGGLHIKDSEGDRKTSNCHVVIDGSGRIVETYRKAHLFDVEVPGKFRLKESDYVSAGQLVPGPVATPLGQLGLGICYDIRFAEHSLALRSAGAEILTFPSAFTVTTGMVHWKPLLQARAIENQCYVIAAAQTGTHNKKRSSYGHSMIVDPWGTVLAECREGINFAMAEIDLPYLARVRENMPVQQQRRPDLYGSVNLYRSEASVPPDDWVFEFGPARVRGDAVFFLSSLSLAFVNKKPVVEGHVLVSPLRSVPSLSDLSPTEVSDLFLTVQKVEKFLSGFYNTQATTISIQDGEDAGQTIPHLHVHILPRRPGDFHQNDDVYRELEQHDKKEAGGLWRDDEAMAAEAGLYRAAWNRLQGSSRTAE